MLKGWSALLITSGVFQERNKFFAVTCVVIVSKSQEIFEIDLV